jgi:hypothetical protein
MPNDPADYAWKPSMDVVNRLVSLLSEEPVMAIGLVGRLFPDHVWSTTSYATSERRLRYVVEEALRQGHPVVANRKGYRLATTAEDLRGYAGKLQRSADGLQQKAELVYDVCQRRFGVDLRRRA